MKRCVIAIVAALMLFGTVAAWSASGAAASSPVVAGIAGEVSWVAAQGSEVPPGGAIVKVKTLTGEAAAARAGESPAHIDSVLVAVGDKVTAGTVVAHVTDKT